ncbi:DNA helicase-2/ATP-dependent DNA helicase PcrA [Paenibacillus phyllosphaerae]|uniref:DNA helicase-2/ATP-dependent DNA helicase PcrA n=1 Tax=Paenibacillus phyllosphaerae TaxID=274593 RepID=A0A7W5AVL5_9BACL|nr:RNA polymerase recycling motor HelD [Paenibacillus phyllosphaerae]MBB3109508.1 DNA helicase-2/ATP-dependent DNA helicase PcrA [Paenibacillus phyllosphaerae]
MANPDQTWSEEQQRVTGIVQEIDRRIAKLEEQTLDVKGEMVDIRKNFWDDVTVNFEDAAEAAETYASMKQQAELLSERERTHAVGDKQLKTLRKLKSSPFFGRIDFSENGEPGLDRIYLGIASMRDKKDEDYLIYDWRAPVSSLYYDYPPGPAEYETPMGQIEGELKLKRQFVIREGEIISLFDTGVTIGDELLQEVLGKQSDAQMKSIVATIQREQNRIIRNERSRLLVVQGAAGSGKTSAALQRVAYLLYRYRGVLRADQIVLFSPNPMFNSYVATVLPELGEENMQQTTFQNYIAYRLRKSFQVEGPYEQLEYSLASADEPGYGVRMEGIRYKASAAFVRLMDAYLESLRTDGMLFRNLSMQGEQLLSGSAIREAFYSLDSAIATPNRLKLVAEWLLGKLKERETAALEEEWVEQAIELLDKETYLKAYRTLRKKKRFSDSSFDDFDMEKSVLAEYVVRERFKPLRARIKKLGFVDLRGIFRQLLADPETAKLYAASGDALPSCWGEIAHATVARLDEGFVAYEDATPFLYLVERIRGFQTNTTVRHILMDEAQDYTAFQFAFMKRLFPRAKVTALGDLNQSIHAHSSDGSGGFSALAALYDPEETERIVLTRSYRSTRPIVQFTSKLVEDGDQIEPFNRDGKLPVLHKSTDEAAMRQAIVSRIAALQADGYHSIAVICKTAGESAAVFEQLAAQVADLALLEKDSSEFERGVVVIPSYLAKGVEFDAVLVYDASNAYGRESERRLFYTVCTRAMHELYLYTASGWSPFITDEAKALSVTES